MNKGDKFILRSIDGFFPTEIVVGDSFEVVNIETNNVTLRSRPINDNGLRVEFWEIDPQKLASDISSGVFQRA